MPKDPVLAAHLVSDNCFEIGGEFSPASIRDQMVRASLVVERLIQGGLIDENGFDLLVVGAGPTGLTAALHAVQHRVRTVVVDQRDGTVDTPPFRLGDCPSRDVDPTLYDWPAPHWSRSEFPWANEWMPLPWDANKASRVATQWSEGYQLLKPGFGNKLSLRYNTTIDLQPGGMPPAAGGDDKVEVSFRSTLAVRGPSSTARFGAVLSCVGWGDERRDLLVPGSLHHYRSFGFWERDEFETLDFAGSPPPRVLLSGGGDGALQDLIRIMTAGSTSRAFGVFVAAMRGHDSEHATVREMIWTAEDIAQRALSWNMDEDQDAPILSRLEEAHRGAIAYLKGSGAWSSVEGALRGILVRNAGNILIAHRKAYFTQCYGLNRFLTLLLLSVAPPGIRRPCCEVTSIEGTMHVCALDADACDGQAHRVTFTGAGAIPTQEFDVIILRHGIEGPRRFFTGVEPTRTRQILPYFVQNA